jgi:hypothetical protein
LVFGNLGLKLFVSLSQSVVLTFILLNVKIFTSELLTDLDPLLLYLLHFLFVFILADLVQLVCLDDVFYGILELLKLFLCFSLLLCSVRFVLPQHIGLFIKSSHQKVYDVGFSLAVV